MFPICLQLFLPKLVVVSVATQHNIAFLYQPGGPMSLKRIWTFYLDCGIKLAIFP